MKRAIVWCAVSTLAQAEDEKESLPTQEAQARAVAERHGWLVVDVLRVPGHSRSYLDFWEMARDAAAKDIHAFYRLIEHCEKRDFDVLIARDGNRFAREQPPHSFMIHRVIRSGAFIQLLNGGRVSAENVTGFVAIDGYAARNEIEQLNRRRDIGLTGRAKRGLPVGSRIPLSHVVIRDELGRAQRMEVNADKRALFDDLATLILEGIGWTTMEQELFTRFGQARPNGKPYPSTYFYKLLHNPVVWGHSSRYHIKVHNSHKGSHEWAYDLSVPPPDGVLFFPNTHPALYQGEQATAILNELRRRRIVGKGQSKPHRTHMFAGLLACAECGYTLRAMGHTSGYPAYYCDTRRLRLLRERDCSITNYVPQKRIQAWFALQLQPILDGFSDSLTLPDMPPPGTLLQQRLVQIQADIAELEAQARVLIRKQMSARESLQSQYDEELNQIGLELERLRTLMTSQQRELLAVNTRAVEHAVEDLRRLDSIEGLWQAEERTVNQLLHALLAGRQVYVRPDSDMWVVAPRVR